MDQNELITMAGVFFGGILLAFLGYKRKDPERQDTVVAGVGLEFGNRLQNDQLIAEVKRCADSLAILADRKQAGMEAKLDNILREMHEAEEREKEKRDRQEREARRDG